MEPDKFNPLILIILFMLFVIDLAVVGRWPCLVNYLVNAPCLAAVCAYCSGFGRIQLMIMLARKKIAGNYYNNQACSLLAAAPDGSPIDY